MPKLVEFTNKGLYVPDANVYIDPWWPVDKAIVTHAHSDHARLGHKYYASTNLSIPILKYRLGNINVQGFNYGESFTINGVRFSFHPAGHVIGSAQIRIEYKGEVYVFTGDYKRENDYLSTPFEPVKCHKFITECTFGLPVFKWEKQEIIFEKINQWWERNAQDNRPSIISAYALGKAQRILKNINKDIGPIFCHGAIYQSNDVFHKQGIFVNPGKLITQTTNPKEFSKALIICPPSALNSAWSRKFKNAVTASASGWMAIRGNRRRRGTDTGFILSDHVDWPSLNESIKETQAEKIFVTHGYTDVFSRWLSDLGYDAEIVKTEYGTEEEDLVIANEENNNLEELFD